MRRPWWQPTRGFTAVEVVVALSIVALLVLGITQVFEPGSLAYQTSRPPIAAQRNGRVAMDLMVRQIRMAGYFPENVDDDAENDQAHPIEIATDTALAIAGDLDGSGTSETHFFCLDSDRLRLVRGARGVAGSYTCATGAVLAAGIMRLRFAYYDADDAPVPDPLAASYQLDAQMPGAAPDLARTTQRAAVRRIVITLTASESAPQQPTVAYTLTSDVRLRNP